MCIIMFIKKGKSLLYPTLKNCETVNCDFSAIY